MLSRLGKGSTYKGKQGELEFLNYGAHDGGGGGWWVAQSVDDVDGSPDWRRLGVADCCHQNEFSQSRPANPPQFFDIGSRQPSDRVIGYLSMRSDPTNQPGPFWAKLTED